MPEKFDIVVIDNRQSEIGNQCFRTLPISEILKETAEDAFGMSLHNPPKA